MSDHAQPGSVAQSTVSVDGCGRKGVGGASSPRPAPTPPGPPETQPVQSSLSIIAILASDCPVQ